MGNIINGVGGKVCGGIGGILLSYGCFEEEEDDCLEIVIGDVQEVDPQQDGEGAGDSGKCCGVVPGEVYWSWWIQWQRISPRLMESPLVAQSEMYID